MPSTPPPPRTSRLDNVTIAGHQAMFELDGHPVRLESDAQGPSFAAMQELHRAALADYQAHLGPRDTKPPAARHRAEAEDAGSLGQLLLRLGQWLGRLFPQTQARPVAARAAAAAEAEPAATEPAPSPAEGGGKARAAARAHRPAAARTPGAAQQPEAAPSPSEAAEGPMLQSVFADRDGIHLVWRAGGDAKAGADGPITELTCGFDSAVARRLEACYGELDKLGYKVIGMEVVRPALDKTAAPDGSRRAEPKRSAKGDPAPTRSESEPGLLPGM